MLHRNFPWVIDSATSLAAQGGMEKSPHFLHFIVEMCCEHSGVVVDPFMGGGKTLYACKRKGRHCIAMDSDQATLDLALKRYSLFCCPFFLLLIMRIDYVVFSLIQKVSDVESSFAPMQAMLVDTDKDDDEDLDE
ncbi:hypothetical protein O6H91_03G059100 [Diphasiastrum complanatum]|uniref:Uncharacterized protein n=1 Tax=Diphasiastrum complanatum TaxID=34168 RepID=A0ACC2E757_DIPCM|nr:hypothetical protein O6H91_03G059100 [Diphasiastrum complanatum]